MTRKISYKLSKSLIRKSNDAFLLSLELYNKPTTDYRTESFSLLFSNAWELLMKAYILESNKGKRLSIFKKKKRNQKRKSISLDECLNKLFIKSNDPVKKNIQYISEIRNEAAHLIILELDPYFSRVFQSGVTNYVEYLYNWFEIDVNKKLNPGLISLISDKDKLPEITVLRNKHNKEDFTAINSWVKKFKELEKLGKRGAISINYKIAIVKSSNKADFVLSAGKTGNKEALIVEKTRNPDISHPFNRTKAIMNIKNKISTKIRFTEYDFEARVFVRGYKKSNNGYFYKGKYSGAGQYSQKFIDDFVKAIKKDHNNLAKWRKKYRNYLNRKK